MLNYFYFPFYITSKVIISQALIQVYAALIQVYATLIY